jgi:transcriptional regulator with XRE-family HTH domain
VADSVSRDPTMTVGKRVEHWRKKAGMTRPVLGGLVGRSAAWVKAVENGRLLPPRLPMLLRIAEVLRIENLADLTGDEVPVSMAHFARGRVPAAPQIRAAVQRFSLTPADEPAEPVPSLRARVDAAWSAWHASPDRRRVVGERLPALLLDSQHAAAVLDGPERRAAHAVLAEVYHLAQHVLVNAAEPELLWLVVDRGMAAAQVADDPLALAGAAWTVGNMLRVGGQMDEALQLVHEAADGLVPYLPDAPDEWRGMWGALQLHGAITAARSGRAGDAWAHWDRAEEAVRQLPVAFAHRWTVFGRGNLDLCGISLTVDLWRSREALRRAERISPDTLPSRERRGRLWVEMARGHHVAGDRIAATLLLQRACDEGIDAVKWSPAARAIVDDLIGRPPPAMREDVLSLTSRLGIPT